MSVEERTLPRILIVGDAKSPLIRERGFIGQRAGHEIFWVSPFAAQLAGVRVFAPPEGIKSMRAVRQLALAFVLRRAISVVRPELIHVHYAYQALATNSLCGFHPLVVSVMGGDVLPDQSYRGYRKRFVRRLLDAADRITSKSEFLDTALASIGDYGHKVRRITWGIDLSHYSPMRDTGGLRRQLGLEVDERVFFDPRVADPLYNKTAILSGFSDYIKSGRRGVLVVSELFGTRRYLQDLRQQAQQLGIAEKVRFVGSIEHAQMADYYALADVTISIPASDGFPQTIYEAAACGSFLVLSDLPQYREAVRDGLVARYISPGDSDALAAALVWVIDHPGERAEAILAGRAYAARVADKRAQDTLMCDVYSELLRPVRGQMPFRAAIVAPSRGAKCGAGGRGAPRC